MEFFHEAEVWTKTTPISHDDALGREEESLWRVNMHFTAPTLLTRFALTGGGELSEGRCVRHRTHPSHTSMLWREEGSLQRAGVCFPASTCLRHTCSDRIRGLTESKRERHATTHLVNALAGGKELTESKCVFRSTHPFHCGCNIFCSCRAFFQLQTNQFVPFFPSQRSGLHKADLISKFSRHIARPSEIECESRT